MNSNVFSVAITLIAICFLGSILKVVLPSKRTGSALSFAMAIIIAFSTLTFFSRGIGASGVNFDIDYSAGELFALTKESNRNFVEGYYRTTIQKALYKKNILANTVQIILGEDEKNYFIEKVKIKLADLSYFGNDENIDIAYTTKTVVVEVLNVEEKDVIVYG